ncbi:MAG: hypothetical protein JSW27_05750 [Phycisphaerales bacterium]|nr:MAG: hypothetical protein JSW27_05750 [Phycisphaerales bacterium]
MSTLTKVLIVLLTVFSIFLCGIVVTYVANAENQRGRADTLKRDLDSAEQLQKNAERELSDEKGKFEVAGRELEAKMKKLQKDLSTLEGNLDAITRENAQLVQQITAMGASVEQANALQASQMQQAQAAQQDVVALQADQTRLDTELKETNQLLIEKMAVVAQLEAKNKQLIEANQELESRLNQYLRPSGRAAVTPQPVTAAPAVVQPAAPSTAKDIGLNGRVTDVDMRNALAEISIGAAAGVKPDMKFHVTRGQQFVCDILILDVDADKAVGVLDLVQSTPQAGDVCATNL